MNKSAIKQLLSIPVIVAALGYFVDIYDLLLFSIVRISSLSSLNVSEADQFKTGELLLQVQMGGLLVGGLIWGIMGDKRGRLSVLFGSIILYSVANIANGLVTTVTQYAIWRFIAGVGLAGELGAGITLVSETLPVKLRGYGTALVATVGLFGAVLANYIAHRFEWQTSYFIGGGLGLLLLLLRVSVYESGLYKNLKEREAVSRGDFLQLFRSRERFKRYVGCIMIGLPIWFTIGILVTFSPEFGARLGFPERIDSGHAIMYSYLGLALGDFSSGFISQWVKSRKRVVVTFIFITTCFIGLYLWAPVKTSDFFYFNCLCLGFGIGYWALFVTIAAEQFGTNLRSTVATTVPNFIRGTVIPITLLFRFTRETISESYDETTGIIWGAVLVGGLTVVIALYSLRLIEETFSKDLNFLELD
jgi:MFS family permease